MQPEQTDNTEALSPLGRTPVADSPSREKGVSNLRLQINVLLMCIAAVTICSLVVAEGKWSTSDIVWLLVQISLMSLAAWQLRRLSKTWPESPAVSPVFVLLAVAQLVWELIDRQLLDGGQPFEILSMQVLRNIVLGLGPAAIWLKYQPIAVVMSLFLSLFAATASQNSYAHFLAGAFAVLTIIWLISSHWENVRQRLVGQNKTSLPKAALVIPVLFLVFVAVGASNKQVRSSLKGFLPSSGGELSLDDRARDGVGDGEMLVAGADNIRSFAPIDDAPFLQDDQPSLYDLFDDSYDEPVNTRTDRAVPLAKELSSNISEHLHSRVEKASKEFSTLRETEKNGVVQNANSITSDALFYVAGRVPLHLRMQAYDLFDGINWYPQDDPKLSGMPLRFETFNEKPWLVLPDRSVQRDYLVTAETHALKIINLDTTVIPEPLYTHGIHLDLVDRPDLFERTHTGLIKIDRKQLPRLTPIHLASRAVDRTDSKLDTLSFMTRFESGLCHVFSEIDQKRLKKFAKQIAGESYSRWEQAQEIERYMQSEFVLDPDAKVGDRESLPIEEFLYSTKQGPDYLFATATALLLRSRNIPCRVVSGFYADPKQYDAKSEHTPVYADDVHFWVEVCAGGDDWLTIEPTPGYEVLGPPPGWFERMCNSLLAWGVWLLAHWWQATLCGLAFVATYVFRIEIWDTLDLLWLSIWSTSHSPLQTLVATVAFLQRRATRAGHARPSSMTINRWLISLRDHTSEKLQESIDQLRKDIDIVAYGESSNRSTLEIQHDHKQLTSHLSLRWFQQQDQMSHDYHA